MGRDKRMLMDEVSGINANGSPAQMGKPVQLNPEHSRWLMGFPRRLELLEGYGNAIVPQVAAEFIKAALL